VEELLGAVLERLDAYDVRGDASAVLADEAPAEAGRLMRAAGATPDGGAVPVAVISAVAWMHWNRSLELPGDRGHGDRQIAVELFEAIRHVDPVVPRPLRLPARQRPDPHGPDARAVLADEILRRVHDIDDPPALDCVVRLLRRALRTASASHPERAGWLSDLCYALLIRFRREDDLADLEAAIAAGQESLAAIPARDPDPAVYLSRVASALKARFERLGNVADIDAAVSTCQKAVAVTRGGDPAFLNSLGLALRSRFERCDDLTDLEAAVTTSRAAVKAARSDDPRLAGYLSNLAIALQVRYHRHDDVVDLDAAIAAAQASVKAARAAGFPEAMLLSNLGNMLRIRGWRLNNRADLDAGVTTLQQAVAATPDGDPDQAGRLSNLSIALRVRFQEAGDNDVADLDAAVTAAQQATLTALPGDPDRAKYLSSLTDALLARFTRTGNTTDLDAAVAAAREAVEVAPSGPFDQAQYLSGLCAALLDRFEQSRDMGDLDAAVTAGQQAVAVAPAGHPDRAGWLSSLCAALRTRFEEAGNMGDLDAAVTAGQQAVAATPAGYPVRAKFLSTLCLALLARFEQAGDVADLDAAVRDSQQAVEDAPPGDPDRAWCLSVLSGVLQARFGRTGDVADLDAAIAAVREAIAVTPEGNPRPAFLHNLSRALQARFERDGEQADIDAAVTTGRAAVAAAPASHFERPRMLSSLSVALQARFARSGDVTDLDAAVAASQEAVESTPAGDPDRALYLSMYGLTLAERFWRLRDTHDLDTAIAADREAVESTPAGHPDRAVYLSNLGTAYADRFERHGKAADINAAVAAGQQAVAATPAGHPYRGRFLYASGLELRARFERTQDPSDAQAALDACREAGSVATAPAAVRIEASEAWGELAATLGQWPDAADGYAQAVGFLPLLAWLGTGRSSRERLLAKWGGLAEAAAACAIAAGQPDRAAELLEQGRGVLWSQMLETRTDLAALRQEHPGLAARLDSLRAVLDRPDAGPASGGRPLPSPRDIDARIASARQWDVLLAQVRALPGFQDFARPPAAAHLRRAAAGGTVVMINISSWRCDALLVSERAIDVVPLPGLTLDDTTERVNTYLEALQAFQATGVDSGAARDAMEAAVTSTLEWLWDVIAEPVLDALGHRDLPASAQRWPRVWWCPTGALTIVPLHAAGHHGKPGGSVLDRVISSYTPTLRALRDAQARPQPTSPGRLLMITLPSTPGAPPLPAVAEEQAFLTSHFSEANLTVLAGAGATRGTILRELSAHAWMHASCHGHQDMANPASGGLLPYDWNSSGLVSIPDLAAGDHAGGEFAFLAACKSAIGGVAVLDEAISLAAALHYSGWRHVIGTLWSVWDTDAAQITRDVYADLASDGNLHPARTAEALHHALRDYRRQADNSAHPSQWAPFLHIGP
jgi:hypothetical protein